MGATTFVTVGHGKTAAEAFKAAREDAQYSYGHDGYTGTIAEKSNFQEVSVASSILEDCNALDAKIEDLTDTVFNDKWGPAGCIKLKTGEYVFFGWASE
jgi:hypothetical protein